MILNLGNCSGEAVPHFFNGDIKSNLEVMGHVQLV